MVNNTNEEREQVLIYPQPLFWMSATMLSLSLVIYTLVFTSIRFYLQLFSLYNKTLAIYPLGEWSSVREYIEFAIIMFFTAFICSGICWSIQDALKTNPRLFNLLGFIIFCIISLGLLLLSLSLFELQKLI